MSRKKKHTQPVLFNETHEEQQTDTNAVSASITYEIDTAAPEPAGGVSVTYEIDHETPAFDKTLETAKFETLEQETPKRKALKEFAELWKGLPHHNYMTDEQARRVHKLWQIVTGRTSYYTNCSICTIGHIKALRREAKNEGIVIE